MKRLLAALPVTVVTLLVLAPAALAHDGGEGWWGETNDKVVTNAGFILIVFFPLFVFLMSMLQGASGQAQGAPQEGPEELAGEQQPGAAAGSRIFTEPAARRGHHGGCETRSLLVDGTRRPGLSLPGTFVFVGSAP